MAFVPLRGYQISGSTTASTALRIAPESASGHKEVAQIWVVSGGADTAICLGDSTVSSVATVSSSALTAPNFLVSASQPLPLIGLADNKFISIRTGASTSTVNVVVGYEI